jgi:hypothetical protein
MLSLRYVYFHGFSDIFSVTSYDTLTLKQCISSERIASSQYARSIGWRMYCIVSKLYRK